MFDLTGAVAVGGCDHAGLCAASDTALNKYHAAQIQKIWTANKAVTLKHLGYALATGGAKCDEITATKLIVCSGASGGYWPGSGGTTYGNVFITPFVRSDFTAAEWAGLLQHEYGHSAQWARHGDGFLPLYISAQGWAEFDWALASRTGTQGACNYAGCYNIFEQGAGLKGGFYVD